MQNKPVAICVFCGSRSGQTPAFKEAAEELGHWIAEQGHQLVYGAGDVGLMGALSQACIDSGGQTLGVIPDHLVRREQGRQDLTRFVVTETMHERKKVMFMNSDVVVVLPGGAGSLDEFFEVLTWAQLGLHQKPIFVLNIDGFWDPLEALIHHVIEKGFAEGSLATQYRAVASVEDLATQIVARLPQKAIG